MFFIDTHTHIADESFALDAEDAIQRAIDAGVGLMLQADIDSSERGRMLEMVDSHHDYLRPMIGLYPGSVNRDYQSEIDSLLPYLDSRDDVVAIGEIGLDYHFSDEFRHEQQDALKCQLEIADRYDLPVNIHLRDATNAFFDVLESCKGLSIRGNMHAYSGSYETFERLQRYGDWSVGIGGVVTFKNSSLPEVIKRIPLERILLETDAPYLTPTPHRGQRNESMYLPLIAEKIAEIKGTTIDRVAEVTTASAIKLFGLHL